MAKNNLKGVMRAWERHQQAKSMRDAMNGKFDTAPDARTARLEAEAQAKVDGVLSDKNGSSVARISGEVDIGSNTHTHTQPGDTQARKVLDQ